ncbi:hypothetical protein KUCAC02_026090, partial [Chaenocephalus aceratus]
LFSLAGVMFPFTVQQQEQGACLSRAARCLGLQQSPSRAPLLSLAVLTKAPSQSQSPALPARAPLSSGVLIPIDWDLRKNRMVNLSNTDQGQGSEEEEEDLKHGRTLSKCPLKGFGGQQRVLEPIAHSSVRGQNLNVFINSILKVAGPYSRKSPAHPPLLSFFSLSPRQRPLACQASEEEKTRAGRSSGRKKSVKILRGEASTNVELKETSP